MLHDKLLDKVFSLPMSFFDTQPSGRLLSRFSKDVAATDMELPGVMSHLVQCVVGVLVATSLVVVMTKGAVLLGLVPLVPMYMFVQNRYLLASRELNRLGSVAGSPVLTHFRETVSGLMTVRAFGKQVSHHSSCQQHEKSTAFFHPDRKSSFPLTGVSTLC